MFVTYDLEQRTRSGGAIYPKVKRVYIAGEVRDVAVGDFVKRSGRRVHGVPLLHEHVGHRDRRAGQDAREEIVEQHAEIAVQQCRCHAAKSAYCIGSAAWTPAPRRAA